METVKILIIDINKTPVHKEKHEFPAEQKNVIQTTILNLLNAYGKGATALIKYKNEYYETGHTAQGKAESKEYYKPIKISYHPFMKELV